jgi:hypothetical protein
MLVLCTVTNIFFAVDIIYDRKVRIASSFEWQFDKKFMSEFNGCMMFSNTGLCSHVFVNCPDS